MRPVLLLLRHGLGRRKSFSAAVVMLSTALVLLISTIAVAAAKNASRYDDLCASSNTPDAVLSFTSGQYRDTDGTYFEKRPEVARNTVTTAFLGSLENQQNKPDPDRRRPSPRYARGCYGPGWNTRGPRRRSLPSPLSSFVSTPARRPAGNAQSGQPAEKFPDRRLLSGHDLRIAHHALQARDRFVF